MLDSWYRRQRGAVLVLGVDQQEPRGTVASYLREVGATYPVVLDGDGSVSDRYDVVGLPTSLLVNRHGVVAAVHQGAIDAAFLAKLHSLLSG